VSNDYTVVGVPPGCAIEGRDGTFVEIVRAMTPVHAAMKARRIFAREPDEYDNVEILAVFEGRHTDVFSGAITDEDEARLAAFDAELAEEEEER